jgi:hypothetical protein
MKLSGYPTMYRLTHPKAYIPKSKKVVLKTSDVMIEKIGATIGQKACLLTSFAPNSAVPLLPSSSAKVNLMKAILGLAWAVAVVIM